MTKRKAYPTHKLPITDILNIKPQSKRQKDSTSTDPVPFSIPPEMIQIIDLNEDCLECVFKYLEIRDLMRLSEVRKLLKSAISLAYASRFGQLRIRLFIYPHGYSWFDFKDNWIIVQNMTACLRFLRCFGHKIRYLDIDYDRSSRQNRVEIDKYVNQYCADSLIRLRLYSAPKWTMDDLVKPFAKVESIKLSWCFLASNLIDFNQWFPNMRRLKISYGNQVIHREHIEKTFPHLEFLSIEMIKCQRPLFDKSNVMETLRLNPQLKVFRISGDVLDAKFLQSAKEHLQWLESLEVIWYRRCFNIDDVIHVNSIKKLKIIIWNWKTQDQNVNIQKIPFLGEQIEEFEITTHHHLTGTDANEIVDFVKKHPKLRTFTLNSRYEFHDHIENVANFIKALNSMENINFQQFPLTMEAVIDFLSECKSLETFRFALNDRQNQPEIQKYINDKWKMSIECNGCKKSRNCTYRQHHLLLERKKSNEFNKNLKGN